VYVPNCPPLLFFPIPFVSIIFACVPASFSWWKSVSIFFRSVSFPLLSDGSLFISLSFQMFPYICPLFQRPSLHEVMFFLYFRSFPLHVSYSPRCLYCRVLFTPSKYNPWPNKASRILYCKQITHKILKQ
jgi:hypothetical protein